MIVRMVVLWDEGMRDEKAMCPGNRRLALARISRGKDKEF